MKITVSAANEQTPPDVHQKLLDVLKKSKPALAKLLSDLPIKPNRGKPIAAEMNLVGNVFVSYRVGVSLRGEVYIRLTVVVGPENEYEHELYVSVEVQGVDAAIKQFLAAVDTQVEAAGKALAKKKAALEQKERILKRASSLFSSFGT